MYFFMELYFFMEYRQQIDLCGLLINIANCCCHSTGVDILNNNEKHLSDEKHLSEAV